MKNQVEKIFRIFRNTLLYEIIFTILGYIMQCIFFFESIKDTVLWVFICSLSLSTHFWLYYHLRSIELRADLKRIKVFLNIYMLYFYILFGLVLLLFLLGVYLVNSFLMLLAITTACLGVLLKIMTYFLYEVYYRRLHRIVAVRLGDIV